MSDRSSMPHEEAQPGAARPKPNLGSEGEGGTGGLANGLQPGGTTPGGGAGASIGAIGTGGGSDAGRPTGDVKKTGR